MRPRFLEQHAIAFGQHLKRLEDEVGAFRKEGLVFERKKAKPEEGAHMAQVASQFAIDTPKLMRREWVMCIVAQRRPTSCAMLNKLNAVLEKVKANVGDPSPSVISIDSEPMEMDSGVCGLFSSGRGRHMREPLEYVGGPVAVRWAEMPSPFIGCGGLLGACAHKMCVCGNGALGAP